MRHYCKVQCKRTRHCWRTTPNVIGCYMLRPFAYPVACCCVLLGVVAQTGLKRVKHLTTRKRTQRARSIQPKFPEISVQNSMDRFGPTGKVSKKTSPPFEVDHFSRKDRSEILVEWVAVNSSQQCWELSAN